MKIIDTRPIKNLDQTNEILNVPLYDIKLLDQVINIGKYKNIIFFMGTSGRKILNETLQEWDLDYEEKKSLTSNDSFILNIKKIKKKIS